MTISCKEAREPRFWLRLLKETNIISEERQKPLLAEMEEIQRIIGRIQKTHRQNNPS